MSFGIRNDRKGFTLVELMVVMLITMFVLYAATQTLGTLVIQFKQQAKITDTNISSILGLEILRRDIHGAGFGLAYSDSAAYDTANNIPSTFGSFVYQEVAADVENYPGIEATNYNDAGANPPRAITSVLGAGGDGVGPNGSDYLVIKSVGVASNPAAGKFHLLRTDGTANTYSPASLNLVATDRVIVLSPDADSYTMVLSAGEYSTTFTAATISPYSTASLARVIYGVDNDNNLRAPFNRADYYISYRNVPERCAHLDVLDVANPSDRTGLANPGTGVLVKVIMDHKDGDFNADVDNALETPAEIPILDCVADFKVAYGLDTDANDNLDTWTDDTSLIDATNDAVANGGGAFDIRRQVREVRIYILAHEGAFSPDFQYTADPDGDGNPNTIAVGDNGVGHVGATVFDVSTMDPRWQNFRWKLNRLTVKPIILR